MSVQTAIEFSGVRLATVSHEGWTYMRIEDGCLICHFAYRGATTTLAIRVDPEIVVDWASLRTE